MPDEEIPSIVGRAPTAPPEPEIDVDNEDYLRAFWDIARSRAQGFGAGAIPASEIGGYWDRAGVGDYVTFLRRINAADDEFLAWHNSRKKERRT